ERAHRHLLRLGCLFASVERAPDRPREQGIFEQLRQRAPEPLLGRAAEAIAQALGDAAPVRHARALLHRSLSDARSAHAVGRTAKEGYGAAMAERLFLFVQFEFPWELGPPDGRFVLRAAGGGEGEQVAGGHWRFAHELPADGAQGGRWPGGRRYSAALRPGERLAQLMGGRAEPLLCEELTLRARLDLDQGRLRHAAIELLAAYAAALPELRAEDRQDLAPRIAELEELSAAVGAQERAARAG